MAVSTNTDIHKKKQHVIDASFVLSFLYPDENSAAVENFFDKYSASTVDFIAPVILPFEVFNGLRSGILTKRVSPKKAQKLGEKFLALQIKLFEVSFEDVFSLSLHHTLAFYDASYVYLAMEKKVPLLTLDKRLAKLIDST